MLTGPRINAGVVTPSHGLFLTCRGEKYLFKLLYINIICTVFTCEDFKCKISLTWGVGLQCRGAKLPPL
jgi:hypothetical protein